MYQIILVPLDGSPFCEWALPAAVGIARGTGAKLELVTVDVLQPILAASRGLTGDDAAWLSAALDRPSAYLQAVGQGVSSSAAVSVGQTVRTGGKVAEGLLEHAAQVGADLIVMATHGYGPLKRAWLGSAADAVARHSRVPVLMIRPEEDGAPVLPLESLFRHVLVPLDGSETAEEVLPHALALGQLSGATYTLLRVVPPPFVGAPTDGFPAPLVEQILRENREAAEAHLAGVATQLRSRKLQVDTVVTVEPFAAGAILDQAERLGSDLIALTTHGRGGLGRLMMGSVADKVVRGASVPVLLYRARGPGDGGGSDV